MGKKKLGDCRRWERLTSALLISTSHRVSMAAGSGTTVFRVSGNVF